MAGGALVGLMLLGTGTSVMAYSGSYSFDMTTMVEGPRHHSLDAKPASTTVSGNTYLADGSVTSSKSTYKVALIRFLKSYSTSSITADGYSYTRSFGTVTKDEYAARVTVVSKPAQPGNKIIGSGTINQ